jgi:hypothetical protein
MTIELLWVPLKILFVLNHTLYDNGGLPLKDVAPDTMASPDPSNTKASLDTCGSPNFVAEMVVPPRPDIGLLTAPFDNPFAS